MAFARYFPTVKIDGAENAPCNTSIEQMAAADEMGRGRLSYFDYNWRKIHIQLPTRQSFGEIVHRIQGPAITVFTSAFMVSYKDK
ncbi:hypothetical protein PPOP_1965 [Paenibacillus popilliae ATCC 14706]|uniref:Uncharacterized protein n=1 Tax=Paenibacillus popilliae ATCC 14706 TaxID=1212764 RepID=M9M5I9_PAEPP|nr:hypothetical protein PPOP_1965 [Paenibacillus popilliae ATCC 14706]